MPNPTIPRGIGRRVSVPPSLWNGSISGYPSYTVIMLEKCRLSSRPGHFNRGRGRFGLTGTAEMRDDYEFGIVPGARRRREYRHASLRTLYTATAVGAALRTRTE